jgi:hypothetical protein
MRFAALVRASMWHRLSPRPSFVCIDSVGCWSVLIEGSGAVTKSKTQCSLVCRLCCVVGGKKAETNNRTRVASKIHDNISPSYLCLDADSRRFRCASTTTTPPVGLHVSASHRVIASIASSSLAPWHFQADQPHGHQHQRERPAYHRRTGRKHHLRSTGHYDSS